MERCGIGHGAYLYDTGRGPEFLLLHLDWAMGEEAAGNLTRQFAWWVSGLVE